MQNGIYRVNAILHINTYSILNLIFIHFAGCCNKKSTHYCCLVSLVLGKVGDRFSEFFYLYWSGGAESACTIFKRPFLHEKRGLEVQNFVTFPNSL